MYMGKAALAALFVALQFCRGETKDVDRRFLIQHHFDWGPWTQFSDCKPSCQGGTKYRTRDCYDSDTGMSNNDPFLCPGNTKEVYNCVPSDCNTVAVNTACVDTSADCSKYDRHMYCQDPYTRWANANCARYCGFCTDTVHEGVWSSWSPFSSCSRTCGMGTMFRTRTCYGPQACIGLNTEKQQCFQQCPVAVNGNWGPWSKLSSCSQSCGQGTETRVRQCDNPPPSNGGQPCPGIASISFACAVQLCRVDGGWDSWGPWTTCSTSCGLGSISRIRTCSNPPPQGGGTQCTGKDHESHECSRGPCPTWSHWFEGNCSASCGNGTMERLRHCSTGRDADCGGNSYELVPCNGGICV